MHVVGGSGFAVRFMAGLATNRAVNRVGGRIAVDSVNKTLGSMAPDALAAGWTRWDSRGRIHAGMLGDVPFGAFDVVGRRVMALVTIAGINGLGNELLRERVIL